MNSAFHSAILERFLFFQLASSKLCTSVLSYLSFYEEKEEKDWKRKGDFKSVSDEKLRK